MVPLRPARPYYLTMNYLPAVRTLALPWLALALASCSRAATAPPAAPTPAIPSAPKPTLVVLITIDQMRPDYYDRFKGQLTGGLARLFQNGARYLDGHHDHAITETAPGHATLMSGRFPRSTGITRNLAGVNSTDWPLIGATDLGAAPFRFRGTTLTDWLTAVDPATRALSVSAKDRAAILPIGRAKHQVYWYANNGTFTTSTWYRDTLPTWVSEFNALRLPHRYAGRQWTTLRPASDYPEIDSVPYEAFGRNVVFPHEFPADSAAAASQARFTPMVDEMTLRFALQGLRQLDLGRTGSTDVLAVSLSATDYIGHYFGPESREQHDQIVRLDRVLGAFLDTLFTLRDSNEVVIALTADHGGGLIPELHGGLRVDVSGAFNAAKAQVRAAGGDTTAVDIESGAFFVDPAKLGPNRLTVGQVTEAFIAAVTAVPGVLRADRFADFARRDPAQDKLARRWLQMFPDDMLPTAVVTLREGNIYNYPIVATHGSFHDYDSHVPMVFYGPAFKPGRYPGFVRTVDIAPTLAAVLRVKPTEPVDGRILTEIIR